MRKEGHPINLQIYTTAIPYIVALILSGLIAILLSFKVHKAFDYHRTPFSRYFILMMLSISLWSMSYAFEVGFVDVELKYFFARFQYLGIALVPVTWFLFAAEYSGTCKQQVEKYRRAFFLLPFLTILLVLTNSFQKLYFESYYLDTSGAFPLSVINYGSFFRIFYVYSLILIVLGTSFFFKKSAFQTSFYRNQIVVVLMAVSIPLLGNILHIEHVNPFKFFDPTPFLFTVTGLIFYWGIMKYEFLSIIPIARKSVIESMNDGYVVADFTDSIVDINKSALELVGKSRKEVVGKNVNEIFGEELKLSNNTNDEDFFAEISLKSGFETKFFDLNISYLTSHGNVRGKLMLIHDISKIYRYQEALKQANKKINLMNNITRHDILNQVNVLSGYTTLISESLPQDVKNDPRIAKYLRNLNKGIEIIHNQISFTKDYQELGLVSPTWQSISSLAKKASLAFCGQGLKFSIEEKELEVYADPLFEKVFYNLFQNSRAHGERVTEITVSYHKINGNLIIEITDDGVGVPLDIKETIFEKSFGKNTGMGLFLVRNILSITGMDINENGTEGEGAKFIIKVPYQDWREK